MLIFCFTYKFIYRKRPKGGGGSPPRHRKPRGCQPIEQNRHLPPSLPSAPSRLSLPLQFSAVFTRFKPPLFTETSLQRTGGKHPMCHAHGTCPSLPGQRCKSTSEARSRWEGLETAWFRQLGMEEPTPGTILAWPQDAAGGQGRAPLHVSQDQPLLPSVVKRQSLQAVSTEPGLGGGGGHRDIGHLSASP